MILNVGAGGATDADKIKYGDSNVGDALDELNESLTNENSETFNFGVKDGVRGFYTNPSRADDSFIPFSKKGHYVHYLCVNYYTGDMGRATTKIKSKGCTKLKIGAHFKNSSMDNLLTINGVTVDRSGFSTPREFDISQYTNDEYITVAIQTSGAGKDNYLSELETY